jgi:hypothetical protein
MRAFVSRALVVGALLAPGAALAEPPGPAPSAAPAPAPVPRAQGRGLAVLAVGDGSVVARALYGKPALRPAEVDEAHARVLAGESPPAGAAKYLTDLAETRSAIHGDDAPSRQLLASIATQFHLRGIVVVMPATDTPPQARVFVAESGAFDAARYAPDLAPDLGDAGAKAEADWSGAAASLDRAYAISLAPAPTPSAASAPSLATHPLPENKEKDATSRPFYASPWFWGAVGAAALGATALYFATRDNSPSQIHLQLQVPK